MQFYWGGVKQQQQQIDLYFKKVFTFYAERTAKIQEIQTIVKMLRTVIILPTCNVLLSAFKFFFFNFSLKQHEQFFIFFVTFGEEYFHPNIEKISKGIWKKKLLIVIPIM